jgi:acetylglutamate kinase
VRPLVVVKVGGEVITKDLPALVSSLRFLRDFGLLPVVVHGGGPQLNDELAKAGVAPQYIGGHRVTDVLQHQATWQPHSDVEEAGRQASR